MFDLASLDTQTLGEAGVAMPIINPRTRLPYKNEDGSELSITLLGRHSETFRSVLRQSQTQRADLTSRGRAITDEQREKEDIETLIQCTREWTFQQLDGKPFPCTPPNIKQLWNDSRFRSLRETAIAFILNDQNFLPPSTENSGAGLDGNSSPTAGSPTGGELSGMH